MIKIGKKRKDFFKKGQAMILTMVLFMFFSLTAILGIVSPVVRHMRITRNIIESKKGFYLTESGMEDVVYRMKNGLNYLSSNVLFLEGETANTTVTDTFFGKTVISVGNNRSFIRKVELNLITGVGAAFNYGIQSGTGGFFLNNNSGVNGNVYSNGPISGSSGAYIAGSAFSSNSASMSVNTENIFPVVPPNEIIFGNADATQDAAQSFTVTDTGPIGKVALYIKKISTPSNITIRITTDNGGKPSSVSLSNAVLPASLITPSFGWVEIPMPASSDLVPGQIYWLVLDASTNSSRYYVWGANSDYANGLAKAGRHNISSWSEVSGLDGYFKIYLGGLTGVITGVEVGALATDIAHAHTVNNSDITGPLYCQSGSGNNKACDTSLTDPTPLPFPISDANVNQWKTEAEWGEVIVGNVNLEDGFSSLGPAKIIGDLNVINNYNLTINGTVWVTGNINFSNNVNIRLAPSYGESSGVIVSDGKILVTNNTKFFGSGQNRSYIMVLTTSDCPNNISCAGSPAINVGNNTGAVVLNAQRGTISFSNNAGAKEATANMINLSNNATIDYETGLANVNFSNGPSGGFDIISWKEVE